MITVVCFVPIENLCVFKVLRSVNEQILCHGILCGNNIKIVWKALAVVSDKVISQIKLNVTRFSTIYWKITVSDFIIMLIRLGKNTLTVVVFSV